MHRASAEQGHPCCDPPQGACPSPGPSTGHWSWSPAGRDGWGQCPQTQHRDMSCTTHSASTSLSMDQGWWNVGLPLCGVRSTGQTFYLESLQWHTVGQIRIYYHSIISYDSYLLSFWHPWKFMILIHSNVHFLTLFCGLVLVCRLCANFRSKIIQNLLVFKGVYETSRRGNKLAMQFTAACGLSCTYTC